MPPAQSTEYFGRWVTASLATGYRFSHVESASASAKVLSRTAASPLFSGGPSSKSVPIDSSDEEGAHLDSTPPPTISPTRTIATQTVGTWMEHIQALGESSSLTLVEMNPIKDQFWAHILSCMKMPRGGVNGKGSMHCEFEIVAPNEKIVQHLMEDLPLMEGHRYNLSIAAPHWEKSPSISTYHALDHQLIDSYFRLHRRPATRVHRGYRGSVLAAPPDSYQSSVCMLSVCAPFLVELCRRKHQKLVLAVSFNLCVLNDSKLITLPPILKYAVGMDVLLQTRAMNHLRKLRLLHFPMSDSFTVLVQKHVSTLSGSEGEWVAPPSDLSVLGLPPGSSTDPVLDSGADELDAEEEASLLAAADRKRPRAVGTRWEGNFRQ